VVSVFVCHFRICVSDLFLSIYFKLLRDWRVDRSDILHAGRIFLLKSLAQSTKSLTKST